VIRLILAGFGYAKITKESVELAMVCQSMCKRELDCGLTQEEKETALEATTSLLNYMRSCRGITARKDY